MVLLRQLAAGLFQSLTASCLYALHQPECPPPLSLHYRVPFNHLHPVLHVPGTADFFPERHAPGKLHTPPQPPLPTLWDLPQHARSAL